MSIRTKHSYAGINYFMQLQNEVLLKYSYLWQEEIADAIEDNYEEESIEHWDNYGPKLPNLL